MYNPPLFREDRVPVLFDAIEKIGLGTLIAMTAEGLEANHIPMLVDPKPEPFGTLLGHVARANPIWQNIEEGSDALAIFLGANAYISPSWYPSKKETGKGVPTWNYLAIHAYGKIRFYHDAAELKDHVGALSDAHETGMPEPWAISDAPADYIETMVQRIVGFRLTVTRLEGKWKMSQNREAKDTDGAREGLLRQGGEQRKAVADTMAKLG